MGWLICDGKSDDHEGYFVGIVRDNGSWRELHYGDGAAPLVCVQVGRECGWRSPRFTAPLGTRWLPCSVSFRDAIYDPESIEDAGVELWQAHVYSCNERTPRELCDTARRIRYATPDFEAVKR